MSEWIGAGILAWLALAGCITAIAAHVGSLERRLLTQRARINELEARLEAVMGAARVLAAHANEQDARVEALLRAATALEEGRPWLS